MFSLLNKYTRTLDLLFVQVEEANMQKKGIEIEIEISQNERCILVLTPQNYRTQFKEFIREHGFDQRQAFLIKNLVQSKMISVYNGYEEKQESKVSQLQIKQQEEVERELVVSPKFGRLETKQTQTEPKIQPQVKYFPSKENQEEESVMSTKMQSMMTPNNHILLKEEETAEKMWSESEFNVKTNEKQYKTEEKHYHQQSSPSMPTVKRLEKDKYGNVETTPHKKKSFMVHSPSQSFDRLYEPTESFKNKKNKDVDHKQEQDYQQVEKYLMNQQLKRTTQSFFNHLYQTSTASSKGKSHSKEKEIVKEELPLPSPPSKKVSPEKCYKGSSRPSGCRCEMKIVQQQRQKQLKKEKEKYDLIKKRMIQSRKNPPVQPQPNAHKSRSCQKCNPVSPKKPKTEKLRPKMPEPKKSVPRPYLSNLLAESYNQFISEIPHFPQ